MNNWLVITLWSLKKSCISSINISEGIEVMILCLIGCFNMIASSANTSPLPNNINTGKVLYLNRQSLIV